jgi:hypothetical protein
VDTNEHGFLNDEGIRFFDANFTNLHEFSERNLIREIRACFICVYRGPFVVEKYSPARLRSLCARLNGAIDA